MPYRFPGVGRAPFCPSHNTRMIFETHGGHFRYVCDHAPACTVVAYAGRNGVPTSSPADQQTRKARQAAHAAFDPLWRGERPAFTRTQAYEWLRRRMHLAAPDCHIGQMDEAQCHKVIEIATAEREKRAVFTEWTD